MQLFKVVLNLKTPKTVFLYFRSRLSLKSLTEWLSLKCSFNSFNSDSGRLKFILTFMWILFDFKCFNLFFCSF